MKKLLAFFLLLMVIVSTQAQDPKLKKIFNGKNLKGWVEPANNVWWTVNDGVLFVKSTAEKKGSILWTENTWGCTRSAKWRILRQH